MIYPWDVGASGGWKAILTGLIAGVLVGLVVTAFVGYTDRAGLTSGLGALDRSYFKGVFWAAGLFALLLLWPMDARIKKHLAIIWILRGFVTLGAMLFYEYHYVTLDAFSYYRHALRGEFDPHFFWLNGTNTVMILVSMAMRNLPGMDSYHALKVLWSAFGLAGGVFFWRTYVAMTDRSDLRVLWVFCAFPSILFWTSILGKDPLVFLGLSIMTYAAVRVFGQITAGALVLFVVGLMIVAAIRLWTASAVLLALALCFLRMETKKSSSLMLAKVAMWCALVFSMGTMVDNFQISSRAELLDRVNVMSRGWSAGGSQQEVPELKSLPQIIRFLPLGMFTALFRPLPGEVPNAFGLLSGLENLLVLFLAGLGFSWFRREFLEDRKLQFLMLTVLIWSMLYAFISFQNLGSAVRFKVQVLPFLLMIPYIIRHKRMALSE
ncbi:MAG: hypothetical protein AB7P49_02530 [Bdellovibrionales bacterium]